MSIVTRALRGAVAGMWLLTGAASAEAAGPGRHGPDEPKDEVAAEPLPRPSVFLSCAESCFDSFVRQELSYFDFSRDPHLAQVVIVVSRQPAANGGDRFTVRLYFPNDPRPAPPSRGFTLPAGATDFEKRDRLLQTILLLLLEDQQQENRLGLELRLALPRRTDTALSGLDDPWNYWVFSPSLSGTGEGASGYYFANAEAGLTVRRITEMGKLIVSGSYEHQFSGYLLEDGSRISGSIGAWNTRLLYAHSLGRHFSLGGITGARGSHYENLAGHLHGGPLAEWNFFPYSENASQQLRVAYQAGAWANWYLEANTSGVFQELRPYHALSLIADANQSWGSVQWIGQVNQFLDDPALYRLSTGAIFTLRLYEGFAVSFEGKASYVRDLINLRGRPITDEELLLWTAQQPTDFIASGELTLSYTFGSVHNTIVNPRFARVDLEEE